VSLLFKCFVSQTKVQFAFDLYAGTYGKTFLAVEVRMSGLQQELQQTWPPKHTLANPQGIQKLLMHPLW
jgi:hypothetical protein